MAKITTPLTSTQIEAAKSRDKEYSLFDGNGLILLIRKSGTKTWRYRYKNSLGAQIILTLGAYPALTLKQARILRAEFESMIANGKDPKEQQTVKNAKANNANSLENVTLKWLESHAKKKPLAEDTKHKRLRKFENHLFPKFKNMEIDQIKLKDLKAALNIIYEQSVDNAQRIRADLIQIFDFALQYSYIDSNIARDLESMDLSGKKNHRATLKSLDQIPNLIKNIKADTGHPLVKLCLLLTLHTFVRSSEIRFARWKEIDFANSEWLIPATRQIVEGRKHSDRGAKMKTDHLVPLSGQAIIILKQVHTYSGNCDFVFPSPYDKSNFISENTPNDALRRMGYASNEISLHGFRTLARSALGEMKLFSREALEMQMSHQERDDTVIAYTHVAQYVEERKEIMTAWSSWLELIENSGYVKPYEYGKTIK